MAGFDAFGTKWAISTDGGTSYTDVADVSNIDVLDVSVDTLDTTTHSTPSKWRTFVGGLRDAGELSMEINYDPALHGLIWANVGVTTKQKVTLTDAAPAATVVFDAIITGFKAQAPFDDKLTATVSVKVSGAPVITP